MTKLPSKGLTENQQKTTRVAVEAAKLRSESLKEEILKHLSDEQRVFVLSAAPGSGKSYLLLKVAMEFANRGFRVLISTNTNNQANNLIHSWNREPDLFGTNDLVVRVASKRSRKPQDIPSTQWLRYLSDAAPGPRIAISTSSKISYDALAGEGLQFDLLIVEEAFQCTWSKFMQISSLASRTLFIGDRGQIPPVVPVDAKRWDTAKYAPHWSAPEVLIWNRKQMLQPQPWLKVQKLETSWRIPEESLPVVQPFYSDDDVNLDPVASKGERNLVFGKALGETQMGKALEAGSSGTPVLLKVPSVENSAPERGDRTLARSVARLVSELFEAQPSTSEVSFEEPFEAKNRVLRLSDVKIIATKRETLAILEQELQPVWKRIAAANPETLPRNLETDEDEVPLNGGLWIDTPERAQGLDCKVSIIVHPMSGVQSPTEFDLETGRLSVMVSRHKVALFVVSRDNVGEALRSTLPSATQAPSRPDAIGLGHRQHVDFWNSFSGKHAVLLTDDDKN